MFPSALNILTTAGISTTLQKVWVFCLHWCFMQTSITSAMLKRKQLHERKIWDKQLQRCRSSWSTKIKPWATFNLNSLYLNVHIFFKSTWNHCNLRNIWSLSKAPKRNVWELHRRNGKSFWCSFWCEISSAVRGKLNFCAFCVFVTGNLSKIKLCKLRLLMSFTGNCSSIILAGRIKEYWSVQMSSRDALLLLQYLLVTNRGQQRSKVT